VEKEMWRKKVFERERVKGNVLKRKRGHPFSS
jgi:hypothetical protein